MAKAGHFIGFALDPDDLSSQDQFIHAMLNAGVQRRMKVLQTILDNCEWSGACLVWKKHTSGDGRGGGYGRFSFEGTTAAVHRVVYAIVYGPIPGKKQVDHTCNNRLCCNPFHLKHVTHKRNQKLRDKRRAEPKI